MPDAPASTGRTAAGPAATRVLVVGCGFVGSHVVTELIARGYRVVVLTRSQPPEDVVAAIEPADLKIGDAADPAALGAAMAGVEHVVYGAGGQLPAEAEQSPELGATLTLDPLRAVLAALRARPGVGLTYLSSGGTVYGEPDRVPVSEEAETRPFSSYGRLHVICEEEIERERAERGLQGRVLRCSTVYGERQWPDRGQGAVVTFLHRIEHGEPIQLYGGGSSIRDYVYAGDVARAIVDLLEHEGGPSVLNVGSGEATALSQLVEMVERQVGRKAHVVARAERGFDVERIVLDTSRLRAAIGFEPTPLERGIARTHAWLKAAAPQTV